jgi:hypothetical protein
MSQMKKQTFVPKKQINKPKPVYCSEFKISKMEFTQLEDNDRDTAHKIGYVRYNGKQFFSKHHG